jgi:hypothetical protein
MLAAVIVRLRQVTEIARPRPPDGPSARTSTPRRPRGEQARADPDAYTGHDVARVVNAGMHARVGDGACQRNKHRRQCRQLGASADGERERSGTVARWKRRRPRRADERRSRAREGPTSAYEQLGRAVRNGRRDRDRDEAAPGRPPPFPSAEHGERDRNEKPQSRVARRPCDGNEGAVQTG